MANKRSKLAGRLGFWVSQFLSFSVSQFQWFSPLAGWGFCSSPLLRALLVLFGFEKLWVSTIQLKVIVRVSRSLRSCSCSALGLVFPLVGPLSGLVLLTDSGRVIRGEEPNRRFGRGCSGNATVAVSSFPICFVALSIRRSTGRC